MSDRRGIPAAEAGEPGAWRIIRVAETTSTNTDLLALAVTGEATGRTAMVAAHQTAGRGRLDRRWEAPAGVNLLVSLLFDDSDHPARLTQSVGLAAVHAVEALAGRSLDERLGLKWPNDVLLDGRKLAGVLAQRAASGPIVVGIGLNVGWGPDGAASLERDLGLASTPDEVLDVLLAELDALQRLSPTDLDQRFRMRMLTIGQRVRVALPGDRTLVGVARAVDGDGRLSVQADDGGEEHLLEVGDVIHLRSAD